MTKIFLSYRRGDAGGYCGRLDDDLRDRLGDEAVFRDVTALSGGDDFPHRIEQAIVGADVVLAVIGPRWAESLRAELDQDWVVRELELARAGGRRLMPVLVGGASMPAVAQLPERLHFLRTLNAVHVHEDAWDEDVGRLVRILQGMDVHARHPDRRVQIALVMVVLTLAVDAWRGLARPLTLGIGLLALSLVVAAGLRPRARQPGGWWVWAPTLLLSVAVVGVSAWELWTGAAAP